MKTFFGKFKVLTGRNVRQPCADPISRVVIRWNNRHKREVMRIFNAGCPRILTKRQAAEFADAYSSLICEDDAFKLKVNVSAIAGTRYEDDLSITPNFRAVEMQFWGKRGSYYDPYPRAGDLFIQAAKDVGGHLVYESLELESRPAAGDRRRLFQMLAQPSFD